MTAAPRIVSVIVATRDRPALLSEALTSIRALEGDDLRFEILVGDNGTTPETEAVAAKFGAIYAKTDKDGCAAARNIALERATGEFIALLDDDDVWLEGHVRPHIALLDARPDLEAVFGQIITTDPERRPISDPWPESLPDDGDVFMTMLAGYYPQVGATLTRARVLERHGLMDETLIGDSDWDWQMRIAKTHKIGFVPTTCVLFRQRAPGTFDDLQLRRLKYSQKVFFRHALPEPRLWRSPITFARAYFGAVTNLFYYFVDAAALRAETGDRKGALSAIRHAFTIFPTRAVRMLLRPSPLRTALVAALTGRPVGRAPLQPKATS